MRKPRVIILDNEAMVLHCLKKWMAKKGFEVIIFGEHGVCPIYRKNPELCTQENKCADIFISSYMMSRINGIDLFQYQSIKGCEIDDRNKAIIVDFLDDDIKRTDNLRCSFFEKPLRLSEILGWLSECEKRIDLSLPLRDL
jgi:two-component SAPR family response regulator